MIIDDEFLGKFVRYKGVGNKGKIVKVTTIEVTYDGHTGYILESSMGEKFYTRKGLLELLDGDTQLKYEIMEKCAEFSDLMEDKNVNRYLELDTYLKNYQNKSPKFSLYETFEGEEIYILDPYWEVLVTTRRKIVKQYGYNWAIKSKDGELIPFKYNTPDTTYDDVIHQIEEYKSHLEE